MAPNRFIPFWQGSVFCVWFIHNIDNAIGWDNHWVQIYEVTAADSPATGTYRPYGMDCSGYVDWVFNNALSYITGHGGGAAMQHTYCTDITLG